MRFDILFETFLEAVTLPNNNALGGNLAVHGNDVWITDFNNDSLWRYTITSAHFTQFPVHGGDWCLQHLDGGLS